MLEHLSDSERDALVCDYEAKHPLADLIEKYKLKCGPHQLHRHLPLISGPQCETCGAITLRRAARSGTLSHFSCPNCGHKPGSECACPSCTERMYAARLTEMPAAQGLLNQTVDAILPSRNPDPPTSIFQLSILEACALRTLHWCSCEARGGELTPAILQDCAAFPGDRLQARLLTALHTNRLISFCVTPETAGLRLHEGPMSTWPFALNYEAMSPLLSQLDQVIRSEMDPPPIWLDDSLIAWREICAGDCLSEFQYLCQSEKWPIHDQIGQLAEGIFLDLCVRTRDDYVTDSLHTAMNSVRGYVSRGEILASHAPSELLRMCINVRDQKDYRGKYSKPPGERHKRLSLLRQQFVLLYPGAWAKRPGMVISEPTPFMS